MATNGHDRGPNNGHRAAIAINGYGEGRTRPAAATAARALYGSERRCRGRVPSWPAAREAGGTWAERKRLTVAPMSAGMAPPLQVLGRCSRSEAPRKRPRRRTAARMSAAMPRVRSISVRFSTLGGRWLRQRPPARRADERGHGAAASNLGVLLEERGAEEEAEAAYRRADERGDAASAFNLGALLRRSGSAARGRGRLPTRR